MSAVLVVSFTELPSARLSSYMRPISSLSSDMVKACIKAAHQRASSSDDADRRVTKSVSFYGQSGVVDLWYKNSFGAGVRHSVVASQRLFWKDAGPTNERDDDVKGNY